MRTIVGLLAVLALSATAITEVGDVVPVATNPDEALQVVGLVGSNESFTPNAPGDGTVNANATLASLRSASPAGISVKAAIDSQSADAKAPDVVRLNFTGSSGFEGMPAIPFSGQKVGPSFEGKLEPTTIQVQRDGKAIPVEIRGQYTKNPGNRYLRVRAGTALEGKCKFGDKVYTVRVVDGNANLKCGDKTTPAAAMASNRHPGRGDTLVVDYGDSTTRSFYGHPALIDGVWYDVKLSDNGAKIAAKPADIQMSKLRIANDDWSVRLSGTKHVLNVGGSGSSEPVTIPADIYKVVSYARDAKDADGKECWLVFDARWAVKKRVFTASPGETVELTIGTPLTAKVECQVRGRNVSMRLKLVDASGAQENYRLVSDSARADTQVEVLDSTGTVVHTGKFEYG